MTGWTALAVRAPAPVQEALANFLIEETSRGVRLEGEWITAYCHEGEETERCLRRLSRYYQALRQLDPVLSELEVIPEDVHWEDWQEAWREFFKPRCIGSSIVVKPSWEPYEARPGELVIEIDPGRAFGTGSHPSTALCIEELEEVLSHAISGRGEEGLSVLDLGTGSGILGIVAARLGAKRVLGLDIDSDALEAAACNLERNGVAGIMALGDTPLEQVGETFDMVVANLTAPALVQMAAALAGRIRGRGYLLLSGILAEQEEEVLQRFQPSGFEAVRTRACEEWRALLLRRTT